MLKPRRHISSSIDMFFVEHEQIDGILQDDPVHKGCFVFLPAGMSQDDAKSTTKTVGKQKAVTMAIHFCNKRKCQ